MNPCNYAWNITSLAFGRSTDMDISRYKEEHEDSLQILGNVEQSYGCSELMFNIPRFARELTLKLAAFYTVSDFHIIAEIEFTSYSGEFTFWLYFRRE
jgi:hypothetical protein